MFNKENIDIRCTQIIDIVNNFLKVLPLESDAIIYLGTTEDVCTLNLKTNNYEFSKKLILHSNFKRILYDRVFWDLFNKYIDDNTVNITPKMIEDDINGNKWQIIMINTQTNATVILDFAIENNKDFVWISNAIDKWNYRVKAKEFQKTKSR